MSDKKKKPVAHAEFEELHNKYLRALADYQNLEKRTETALEQARLNTKKSIMLRALSVLDDMEKAEVFIKDDGLQMVMSSLLQMLSEYGVEEFDIVGKEYDPLSAEAVEIVEGEVDNVVTYVIQKGYRIGQDILRPAKVRVSKKTRDVTS